MIMMMCFVPLLVMLTTLYWPCRDALASVLVLSWSRLSCLSASRVLLSLPRPCFEHLPMSQAFHPLGSSCFHAHSSQLATACVSSPRDWAVSIDLHMQQDVFMSLAPPREDPPFATSLDTKIGALCSTGLNFSTETWTSTRAYSRLRGVFRSCFTPSQAPFFLALLGRCLICRRSQNKSQHGLLVHILGC